jgi:hypothetical protein
MAMCCAACGRIGFDRRDDDSSSVAGGSGDGGTMQIRGDGAIEPGDAMQLAITQM